MNHYLVQCLLEDADRALDMCSFFESEQTDAEGLEVGRFVALQRHSGGDLEAVLGKILTALCRHHRCSSPLSLEPESRLRPRF
ncbi:hypothetical protein D3C77_648450 [compost metagenome]